jgi:hypothetical protein
VLKTPWENVMRRCLSVALALGLGLTPWTVPAAEPPKNGPGDEPAGNQPADPTPPPAAPASSDPAFDRYLDTALLARAWREMNPALLTDLGLQLAEGERVLLRPHKEITAAQVLALAARAAADRQDKATLARLAKAAEQRNDAALTAQIKSAQKVAGGTRAPDPGLTLAIEDASLASLILFKKTVDRVQAARLAGDRETLQLIQKAAEQMTALPEGQRKHLAKLAGDALTGLPQDAKTDPAAAALAKLAGISRPPPVGQTAGGVYYSQTLKANFTWKVYQAGGQTYGRPQLSGYPFAGSPLTGLKSGDIIVALDSIPCNNYGELENHYDQTVVKYRRFVQGAWRLYQIDIYINTGGGGGGGGGGGDGGEGDGG